MVMYCYGAHLIYLHWMPWTKTLDELRVFFSVLVALFRLRTVKKSAWTSVQMKLRTQQHQADKQPKTQHFLKFYQNFHRFIVYLDRKSNKLLHSNLIYDEVYSLRFFLLKCL